jgi:hypothetical protein
MLAGSPVVSKVGESHDVMSRFHTSGEGAKNHAGDALFFKRTMLHSEGEDDGSALKPWEPQPGFPTPVSGVNFKKS